jgi:DNA-binding LacI/PurR family transcriptional regulator
MLDKRRNKPFPEALFFDDDYIASGALTAMLWAGVHVPEDVRVATFTTLSCGSGLVSPVPLTRTEVDPIACGRTIAVTVLDYLKTGIFPCDVTIGPTYIKGETL